MSFGIQTADRGNFQVLFVSGYLGNIESETLAVELEQLFQQGHRWMIVDFTKLTFVTSSSLVRLAKQARGFQRKGAEIRLCSLPPSTTNLLKLARLEKSLKVATDLTAAAQSVPHDTRLVRPEETVLATKQQEPTRHSFRNTEAFAIQPS